MQTAPITTAIDMIFFLGGNALNFSFISVIVLVTPFLLHGTLLLKQLEQPTVLVLDVFVLISDAI